MQANVYSIDGTPVSPERFALVQDLFVRTLEQGETGRAAFLQQACAGDEQLQREVESLLAEEPRASNFMEGTLEAVARELISTHQRLTAGVRIGHYEITSFLDAGGMGEVYRARDTRLKRDVAIKVLSSEWSQDADRVERFKREAETLAALNHPRIAQIYGLEESGDTLCLILEFVEGDTLADRLAQGALPLTQSLDIARQITEALEAAHERGIIHRDLKPANVKLTPDGRVKVLDFGLAKALSPQPVTSQSPTVSALSMPGLILGTAGYMAPEQARGRPVDARSDIWAFGCVLYEMLVGKTAFCGESVVEVLSAILHVEPDWKALPATTPPAVRSLLQRCLQKDPGGRLRDIADARFQIEDVHSPAVAPVPSPVSSPPLSMSRARERAAWITVAAVLVAGVVGLSLQRRPTSPSRPPEMRLQIVTPPEASTSGFSLSPDGRNLVYTSQFKLWLRPLDSEKVELLSGTEGSSSLTFWSPDSHAIGFGTSDHLKRFDIGGKLARTLSNVPAGVGFRHASWNSAGNLLIGSAGDHLPLYLLSSSDGGATEATQLTPDQTTQGYPYFLPDGSHFLFFARTINGQGIYIGSLDSKQTKHLFDADSGAVFAPPDYILFARRGALLAQRLDLTSLAPVGEPVSVASEVFVDTSVGSTSVRGILAASASSVGVIAFRARGERTQLAWVNRTGQVVKMILGTDQVSDTRQGDDLSLSPDGRTAAFAKTLNGNKDIWLIDLETEIGRRFTFIDGWDGRPIWSPDSKQLIFSSLRKGVLDLYRRATSGTEPEEVLLETSEGKTAHDWSPDGRYILYQSSNPKTSDDLWALPTGNGPSEPVVHTDALECCGRFSPDGRFVAYQSWETGRSEIYIQPFMGAGSKQRISTEGGTGPRWRHDGKEMFYRAADGILMSVSIEPGVAAVKARPPKPLFRLATPVYVPSLDGQSFLTNIVVEPASPITILLNWDPTTRRRAEN